jgi:hypothetical protein
MTDVADRVVVYLDDVPEPFLNERAPAGLQIDTRQLDDGDHVLRIEATDQSGRKGVKVIHFTVRNGPSITVRGLGERDVVEGQLGLMVHAFAGASEENWEPSQAETPAPVPTWAWVLLIGVVAWAMYYLVSFWNPTNEASGIAALLTIRSLDRATPTLSARARRCAVACVERAYKV